MGIDIGGGAADVDGEQVMEPGVEVADRFDHVQNTGRRGGGIVACRLS
jgi:hypothetical protein